MTEPPTRSRTGRALVAVVYVALCAYIAIVVTGSVVWDLYGKPPPNPSGKMTYAERSWCVRRLAGLQSEISSRVTNELQRPDARANPYTRWRTWESAWVDELQQAKQRCAATEGPLSHGFETLTEMHAIYAESVEGLIRARTELASSVASTVEKLERDLR